MERMRLYSHYQILIEDSTFNRIAPKLKDLSSMSFATTISRRGELVE